MSSSKKIALYSDIAAGVYLSEAQNPISPPPPYTLHSVYVYIVYLLTQGRGRGRESEPEGRLKGQQFTKPGRKYQHDWLYLQSINSDNHLPQSPFTG
jgi:hypothetical protein